MNAIQRSVLSDQDTRYLITGGAGFIGSHLCEALLDKGCRVTIIDDLSTGRFENIAHLTQHINFQYAIDTITNETVMDRLVSQCDVIVHLAAAVGVELIVRDPVHTLETNVLGTHAVLQLANRYRCKVLLASTSEIYGKNGRIPYREDDDRVLGPTMKFRWSYSTSKAMDEYLALAYHRQKGLPIVVLRLFNTIGPRQSGRYGMVVPRFVQQALNGEPLTVYDDGLQTRCFGCVSDVVRAIIGLAECPDAVGQIFNVGSTSEITILALAHSVLKIVNEMRNQKVSKNQLRKRIVYVPYEQAYNEGFEDMRRRVPDISRIQKLISWVPQRSLEEALTEITRWHMQEAQLRDVRTAEQVHLRPSRI